MAENLISLDLKDENEIEKNISREFAAYLNSVFDRNQTKFAQDLRLLIYRHITNSPSWQSLLASNLDQALYIPDFNNSLDEILAKIITSADISFAKVSIRGDGFVGGVTISILINDYSDILSLPAASFNSNGVDVEWLNWLLTAGNQVVVMNYGLTFHEVSPQGNNQFIIPSSISGTSSDNVLTRSLAGIEQEIESLINNLF